MRNNGNRVNNRGNRRKPSPNGPCLKSSGPDHTIRGQAKQIAEKYLELAEEASESEKHNLLQHAHHYQVLHNDFVATNRAQPVG